MSNGIIRFVAGLSVLAAMSLHTHQVRAETGTIAPLAEASLGQRRHVEISANGVSAALDLASTQSCSRKFVWGDDGGNPPTSCTVATLTLTSPDGPDSKPAVFPLTLYSGQPGDVSQLRFSLWHLEAGNPMPQVMVSAYTGGAHCCDETSIFGRTPAGSWHHVELGMRDGGDPPAVVDAAHDAAAVIQTQDQKFLYSFASHAGSYAPLVLQRYQSGALHKVTRDPAYHAYLAGELAARQKEWIAGGRMEPNGFLAYYVATESNLGHLGEAWHYMLAHAQSTAASGFGVSRCSLEASSVMEDDSHCSAADKKLLPFPEGLAIFLTRSGYITAAQADAVSGKTPAPIANPVESSNGTAQPAQTYHPDFSCDPSPSDNGVAAMLCANSDAAKHELQFNQVYYALRHKLGPAGWPALKQQVVLDQNDANQQCGLPVPGQGDQTVPDGAAACYDAAMDRLALKYRAQLSGSALEEASRPIDQHIALQQKLIELGYMASGTKADGVYGDASRAGIVAWQQANGQAADGFISNANAAAISGSQHRAESPAAASAVAAPQAPAAVSVQSHGGATPWAIFGLSPAIAILLVLLGAVIYFVPSVLALALNTARRPTIFAVNLLLGWTLLGWFAALTMVFSSRRRLE